MSTNTTLPDGTLIDNHARCLVCDAPKPADYDEHTGKGTWYFLDYRLPWPRTVRPFCSNPCVDAFRRWPESEQLKAIFGNVALARWLIKSIRLGTIRADQPAPGTETFAPQFKRLPIGDFYPCPDPVLLEHEHDTEDSFCMGCARQVLTGYRSIPVPTAASLPLREEVAA